MFSRNHYVPILSNLTVTEVTAKQNILMSLRMRREHTVNLNHRLARLCLSSRMNALFIDY